MIKLERAFFKKTIPLWWMCIWEHVGNLHQIKTLLYLNASYLGTRFTCFVKELSENLDTTFQQGMYTNMCN